MAIALGHRDNPLQAIAQGARCTWFLPAPEGRSARKNWIAGHLAPQGSLTIDDGAMTYMLINAVKELHAEVEALKAELKTLKRK